MAKKILIVDDEADTLTYLKTLLEDHGYQTSTANDGDVALSMAQTAPPDLITLDIIMPRETGVKFYRHLSKDPHLAKIPVIIISGVKEYKNLFAQSHSAPKPFAFLEKPYDKDELLAKVKEAIG